MSRAKNILLILLVVTFGVTRTSAVDTPKPGDERKALMKRLEKNVKKRFESRVSAASLVRGFVTYSQPAKVPGTGPHVAFVFVQWGDLDNVIKRTKKVKGQPRTKPKMVRWDGYVKVERGMAGRAATFSFDAIENKSTVNTTPGKTAITSWRAKAAGATDGILVRLDSPGPWTRGVVKVGPFTIPFDVTARAGAKAETDPEPKTPASIREARRKKREARKARNKALRDKAKKLY